MIMFKISYMLITGRGNFLGGIVNFGEHVFEGLDYAAESLNDIHVTGPDGVSDRIDKNEFKPETLPQTQKDLPNRVFFYLYTRDNPTDGQRLNVNDTDTLQNSNFNVSKYTLIFAHGYNAYYTDQGSGIRNGMRLFIAKKSNFFNHI